MIGRDSFKGYVLEEILAYLVRNSGYRLLAHPRQDPRNLKQRGSGLVVQGRGAEHQVDVLGELAWIPAFTFPIRLFVEAKCKNRRVGIEAVRNAVGVLEDLNQRFSPAEQYGFRRSVLIQQYSYRYALFSTSGFTDSASDMALAHQISLIDLSGREFRDLRLLLDRVADEVFGATGNGHGDGAGQEKVGNVPARELLRRYIRVVLGTLSEEEMFGHWWGAEEQLDRHFGVGFGHALAEIVAWAQRLGELFIGMVSGPFMLVLRPDSAEAFLRVARERPVHRVRITPPADSGGAWSIRPESGGYGLTFGLPRRLADWVFDAEGSYAAKRAAQLKREVLSSITVYHFNGKVDEIFRLEYDPGSTVRQRRIAM